VSDLPVACTLTPAQFQARRREGLSKVAAAVAEATELDNGFIYRFPSNAELIPELAKLIQLEHECCSFLTFRLTVGGGDDPVLLEITGPSGTKELLAEITNEEISG
jgi:hypothetical protein